MKDKAYYKDRTCFEGDWDKAPHHKDSSKIIHREDGPAVEWSNGTKEWYLNGQPHREDGPAREDIDGSREWWVDGKLHRADGPAAEDADGAKEWWWHGRIYSEQEYLALKEVDSLEKSDLNSNH